MSKDKKHTIAEVTSRAGKFRVHDPSAKKTKTVSKRPQLADLAKKVAEENNESLNMTGKSNSNQLTPLEYALKIMNDESQDDSRRDRLAIAAMPFVHLKKGEGGKKDEVMSKAKEASSGSKFSPSAPPKLVVNNK